MNDEFFYNDRKKIIKLFLDESKAKKRFQRSEYIRSIVPKTYISGSNIIWYYLVKGSLLSNTKDQKIFVNFCNFLQKKIWSKRINNESRIPELNQKTMSFYKHKTYKRVNDYISKNKEADKALYINNRPIDPIHKLLSKVDWINLSKGHYTYFHGDPQPENVIVTGNNKFTMIDWREDFGDDLEYGDIYYDLGKIYHSLIITQKKIREEKYFVSYEGDFAQYKFEKRRNLIQYLNYFEKFILTKKYDLKKVKIISALIYLNIAALHHHPYSDLLFFHGKLSLSELLKEN